LNLARLLVTTDYSSNIFLMHEFLIGISPRGEGVENVSIGQTW